MNTEIEAMMTEDQKEELQSIKEGMTTHQKSLLDRLASLAIESRQNPEKLEEFKEAKKSLEVMATDQALGDRTGLSLKLVEKFHVGIEAYYGCESLLEELEARMPSSADYLGEPPSEINTSQEKYENTPSSQSIRDSVLEVVSTIGVLPLLQDALKSRGSNVEEMAAEIAQNAINRNRKIGSHPPPSPVAKSSSHLVDSTNTRT